MPENKTGFVRINACLTSNQPPISNLSEFIWNFKEIPSGVPPKFSGTGGERRHLSRFNWECSNNSSWITHKDACQSIGYTVVTKLWYVKHPLCCL
jgi:hypothetical protein